MWIATVFTVFPEIYPATLGVSNLGNTKGVLWDLNVVDLKRFGDKYGRIDDTPYGGGAGMVLRPDVFERAFMSVSANATNSRMIYLSPRGKKITQNDFKDISTSSGITLLCGRYEGVDQRIIDVYGFEEWSLGDFILMGGDVGALTIIEGCVRLLPGVVQKRESIENDSFENTLLEHNQYTKPRVFKNMAVPDILLSGDHSKIAAFRHMQSVSVTKANRNDLWNMYISKKMQHR